MKWQCKKCEKLVNEKELVIVSASFGSLDYYHEKCWKEDSA